MASGDTHRAQKQDVERIAALAGTELDKCVGDNGTNGDQNTKTLLREMANAAFSGTGDEFAEYVSKNKSRILDIALSHPEVAEMLVLGYKVGISNDNAACMNDLGALYYMGDIVEQDYHKAAELYEMAADAGCYQSVVNLGYIYEYGRIGKPDYNKAYQWYSLAAVLSPSYEATYKLGDMFSRGKAVPHDMKKAYRLYERSLELASNDVQCAQPALRIAKMLIDPEGPSYDIEPNPLRALALFQLAEIGLRIDIADGQAYYAKRLQEAIDGQEEARLLMGAIDAASLSA
ncbi:MAG: tetratricopeptide repeat protein [Eggerthellaceae bacterium]|nr:tetratricopeptide repeat protein [Eggerthellaceae bacterium]